LRDPSDTSVRVDHLRAGAETLADRLGRAMVLAHLAFGDGASAMKREQGFLLLATTRHSATTCLGDENAFRSCQNHTHLLSSGD